MSRLAELRKVAERLNTKLNKGEEKENQRKVVSVAADRLEELDMGMIRTGNPAVDEALGGGLMRGIMSQVVGQQGTGKSHLALDTIAYNQERDLDFTPVFGAIEGPFPYHQAVNAGVDLNRILIFSTAGTGLTGEKVLEIMMNLLAEFDEKQMACRPRNLADLFVLDSVAALLPQAELSQVIENGLAKDTVGRQAAMLSKFMRIFFGTGALGRAHLMLINQKRMNVSGYGNPEVIPGGRAIAYYSKAVVDVRANPGDYLKQGSGDKERVYGHLVKGQVTKNNTGVGYPQAKFQYKVIYGEGVDTAAPLLAAAINRGVIKDHTGGNFTFPNPDGTFTKQRIAREKLEQRVRDEPEFYQLLETLISRADQEAVGGMVGELVSLEELDVPEEEIPEEELPQADAD